MTLVITTCTNRKRKPVPAAQHASTLSKAAMPDIAAHWMRRLGASDQYYPAADLYGGRAFQEAVLAAGLLDARLMVVSAGLGLIDATQSVPPYACTILIDAPDSISDRVTGDFSVQSWWQALNAASPYRQSLVDAAQEAGGLICAALSDLYIDMISDDLASLPPAIRDRLRLFTRAPRANIAPGLHPYVMPYDDRLDGLDSPIRGTRGDFAARALHHFARHILPAAQAGSAADHAHAISAAQRGWALPEQVERVRLDDDGILALIRLHWDAERGSSSRLLRRFRDELFVSCEQGRFADLARRVRAERA